MNERYQRTSRIVKAEDFSAAFRLRPRKRTAHFTLYIRDSGASRARLGLVVAKRFASRAATRNTIKRICREVFRRAQLPDGDYIVRLSGSPVVKGEPAAGKNLKQKLKSELAELFTLQTNINRDSIPGKKQVP